MEKDDDGEYLQLPAKTYIRHGVKAVAHIIDFPTEHHYRQFQTLALKALKSYLANRGGA
jgi:hypothetical protein